MSAAELCAFCDKSGLEWRTIRAQKFVTSFVSMPWFREGQCLVTPNRHITTPAELEADEAVALMSELGRLSLGLDKGFGAGIMQKYQPQQAENGIKVNHLHFHVFPRQENETDLFPVPAPNNYDGFITPTRHEVIALAQQLR